MPESKDISYQDLLKACQFYAQKEQRDYVYPGSITTLQNNFENSSIMAKAISDLLMIWHLNFYRFGMFSQNLLEQCIATKLPLIHEFRLLNIRKLSFADSEVGKIEDLFTGFLDSTAGKNAKFTRRSPTAVSKALNLLAPKCFPLWDEAISQAYDCWWVYSDFGLLEYIKFMKLTKLQCINIVTEYSKAYAINDLDLAEQRLLQECISISGTNYDRSLLKIIDEYNYATYTKQWFKTTNTNLALQ